MSASKTYLTSSTLKAAMARKHPGMAIELLCHVPDRQYSLDVRDNATREVVTSYRVRKTIYGYEVA